MKKKSIVFCILALFLSFQSFAIPKDPCDDKNTCCDEAPVGPFAFSYPKDIGLACPRDFYTYGEFLYMKVSEDGLDYGLTDDFIFGSNPTIGDILGFSSKSQKWDWRLGFRVGFGGYLIHDSWNINATWTYVRIKADAQETIESGMGIVPLFLPHLGFVTSSASARWSGDINTFDIMTGKPYHVSRYFISNPMFGIRAVWIDQDFHARYFNGLNKYNAFLKNDFWGVGIRALYYAEFLLSKNWNIFSKIAGCILFGKFDTDSHSEPVTSTWGLSVKDTFYSVQPNAEITCGINWKKFFHKDQYRISVHAAYEFHHFWEQNQGKISFMNFPPTAAILQTPKGDLSLNGFSFGINLDF